MIKLRWDGCFCFKLLAEDVWAAEDDTTGSLSFEVDSFKSIIFERTTNFLAHGAN